MKLWITGANGFVAKAVQNLCRHQQIPYVATTHHDLDITSLQHIKKFLKTQEAEGITHILNCAAYTHVDQAEKEPDLAHLVNAMGPENLAKIAHEHDLKFLHLSTDYVFGTTKTSPFLETDPCDPLNIYGKTKYEGEQRVLQVYPQACIVRTSWVFGSGGKNFIPTLFEKFQKEEKIFVNQTQRNRLTYVTDLAEALMALLCHAGVFHFANQGIATRFEIAQAMLQELQARGIKVVCRELIPADHATFTQLAPRPIYSVLDTHKIESILGVLRPWQTALREFSHAL
jgi:dTDP-4-dehydrorhamnose reductase